MFIDVSNHTLFVLMDHLAQFLEVSLYLLDFLETILSNHTYFILSLCSLEFQIKTDALKVIQKLVHLILSLVIGELNDLFFSAHKTILNTNCRVIKFDDFESLTGQENRTFLAIGDLLVLSLDDISGCFGRMVVASWNIL